MKIAERVVEAKLARSLRDLVGARKGVTATEAYQEALELSAGSVDALLQMLGEKDDLGPDMLAAMQKLASEHAKTAKIGIDAGLADRAVTLAEGQAALMTQALAAVILAPELGLSVEQKQLAVVLLRKALTA